MKAWMAFRVWWRFGFLKLSPPLALFLRIFWSLFTCISFCYHPLTSHFFPQPPQGLMFHSIIFRQNLGKSVKKLNMDHFWAQGELVSSVYVQLDGGWDSQTRQRGSKAQMERECSCCLFVVLTPKNILDATTLKESRGCGRRKRKRSRFDWVLLWWAGPLIYIWSWFQVWLVAILKSFTSQKKRFTY